MIHFLRDCRDAGTQIVAASDCDGIIGCFIFSRPVSKLSASCPDVAASLWLAVSAAACSPQPRLPLGMGSARDDGDQLLTS